MPEKSSLDILVGDLQKLLERKATEPKRPAYREVAGFMVDPVVLNAVLGELIDRYTVARLDEGELIHEDLLRFKEWVKEDFTP